MVLSQHIVQLALLVEDAEQQDDRQDDQAAHRHEHDGAGAGGEAPGAPAAALRRVPAPGPRQQHAQGLQLRVRGAHDVQAGVGQAQGAGHAHVRHVVQRDAAVRGPAHRRVLQGEAVCVPHLHRVVRQGVEHAVVHAHAARVPDTEPRVHIAQLHVGHVCAGHVLHLQQHGGLGRRTNVCGPGVSTRHVSTVHTRDVSRDGDQVPDIPDDNVQVSVMRQLDVADDEAAHLLHPHLVEGLPDGGEVEAEVQLAAVLQLEALHGRGDEAGEGEDGGAAAAALAHQLLVARQVDTVEVGVGGPGGGEAAGQEGEHQHQHPGACRRSLRV